MALAAVEDGGMKKETALLNVICVFAAIGLLAFAAFSAVSSGDFFTTDNLFLIAVCLVLALMFAVSPLLYLRSTGKLPLPFMHRADTDSSQPISLRSRPDAAPATPALLDAKGRPVPPDVRAIVDKMKRPRQEEV